MIASIPSPHSGVVSLGPLTLHMYGLTLLVAILLCIWLTGRRWIALGGDWDLVTRTAVWGVAFGVIGARLYHDISSWNEVPSPKWQGIFEVWKGGLGIWGGVALGAIVGAVIVRRAGANVGLFLDAAAPGLLLAQGIGRIGNWWNQELYGKPTGLPWGLKIDPEHRPLKYFGSGTFHPTFLYELIWDVIGVRGPDLRRPPLPDQAAWAVRPLHRLVHVRPLLRGAAARRPVPPLRRPPAERLGLDRRLRGRGGLLRPAPVPRPRAAIRPPREPRREPRKGPAMAIPASAPGREGDRRAASGNGSRLPGCPSPCASSSWTWTPSKARSTSCSPSSCARSCP